jgi:hypothetical protein
LNQKGATGGNYSACRKSEDVGKVVSGRACDLDRETSQAASRVASVKKFYEIIPESCARKPAFGENFINYDLT